MTLRTLIAAGLMLAPAPLLAGTQLVETWAPGGKTPVRHYKVVSTDAGRQSAGVACGAGHHARPAGKLAHVPDRSASPACGDRAYALSETPRAE